MDDVDDGIDQLKYGSLSVCHDDSDIWGPVDDSYDVNVVIVSALVSTVNWVHPDHEPKLFNVSFARTCQ